MARWAGTNTWIVQQPYSTSNTWTWNSTGAAAGVEYLGAWVKDAGTSNAYDQLASIPYTVTTPSCASVTVSASPTTVVYSSSGGTHVTVTAAATGCSTSPRYEFWLRPASSGTWQLVQAYSTSSTYDWNSTGAAVGTVYLGVHVRDANSTNPNGDSVANTPVTVT